MTARIVHISDLHFESLDFVVADNLKAAIQQIAPDILVFTGDLVDNFWSIAKGKSWLLQFCKDCKLDAATRLIIIPGNHDYRWIGTFGFRPVTGWNYRDNFQAWNQRVLLFPTFGVSFLRFDSNPIARGFARGVISQRQIAAMGKALDNLSQSERDVFKNSTKIALIHHHPVPVPYEGSDRYLMLNRVQNITQFLAERKINLILHGHKHRASNSLLAIGTSAGYDVEIRVLGAGSAAKKNGDHDPRGHNFNLVTVDSNGLTFIDQYFAPPGKEFRKSDSEDPLLHQTLFDFKRRERGVCHSRHLHWDSSINADGDIFNDIWHESVTPIGSAPLPEMPPKTYSCDTGHLSAVGLSPGSSDNVSLHFDKQESREVVFRVQFQPELSDQQPATYGLRSWDFNAVALDRQSYRRKYPAKDAFREYEQHHLEEVTDRFSWTLQFPSERKPRGVPLFEVLDEDELLHPPLTEAFANDFHYSTELGLASLSLQNPPAGYHYRITWILPNSPAATAPPNPGHVAEVRKFAAQMLAAALNPSPIREQMEIALAGCLVQVKEKIEAILKTHDVISLDELDCSLMVYNDSSPGAPPKLHVVAATQGTQPKLVNRELEIGDGVAGRAFNTNSYRFFDADKAQQDIRLGYYLQDDGHRTHSFLHSIPLRHPESQQLIFAVLNVGTYDDTQGSMLRTLSDEAGIKWLNEFGQNYVLQRAREILKLDVKGPQ